MRLDLLTLLGTEKDITNCIVLTHNIDFVFLQSVVLSELRGCGQPSLTVFADMHCAAETFSHQSPVLNSLGVHYRVVPVLLKPGFRFHPKAVLLSGIQKGILFVGSGNLTFGGWRENAEVWVRFDSDADGSAPFAAFSSYLRQILASVPLREVIETEIAEAFDKKTRAWAADLEGPAGLIGRVKSGDRLVDRMRTSIGSEPVDLLTICSPYFDEAGVAARELINEIQPRRTHVIVQKGHAGLTKRAASNLGEGTKIVPVRFRRDEPPASNRERFMHAKFYAYKQGGRVVVYAGSANCSRAALTVGGDFGNAELLAIQTMPVDEFQEYYLGETEILEGEAELPEDQTDLEEAPPDMASIYVLGASFESNRLHVAYTRRPNVTLTACLVDDAPCAYQLGAEGVLIVKLNRQPRTVTLEGMVAGKVVLSNRSWVDNEQELRSTARTRWLGNSIKGNVQTARWGIGAWLELLKVFYKYTQYIPAHSSTQVRREHINGPSAVARYSEADVFSQGYGLPGLGFIAPAIAGEDRIQSLRTLLLRWFGMPVQEETVDEPGTANEEETPPGLSAGQDEEVVDRPEPIPIELRPCKPITKPSEADRRQARHLVEHLAMLMTTREYLEHREPDLIATDLKIASALFRIGLSQDWISRSEYCQATYQIWSHLFLSSEISKDCGWLEHRFLTANSPPEFAGSLASGELSAALAAWALTVKRVRASPEYAQFIVSCVLSIAHLPWLWLGADVKEIAAELTAVLTHTSELEDGHSLPWGDIEARWLTMVRRGYAMQHLERVASRYTLAELRTLIKQQHVSIGELLWQGKAGLCVATEGTDRTEERNLTVLRLRGMAKSGLFKASFLIPVRGLLGLVAEDMPKAEQTEISRFLDELEAEFGVWPDYRSHGDGAS